MVPVGFAGVGATLAIGKLADALKVSKVPRTSHPLNATVYPRGMRNEFANTVGSVIAEPGSSPLAPVGTVTRPSAVQVLPPRLGGSYIILRAPFLRSIGFRM